MPIFSAIVIVLLVNKIIYELSQMSDADLRLTCATIAIFLPATILILLIVGYFVRRSEED